MARRPDQPGNRAPFVREIVSDPNSVPDVMLLYGYLGASSEPEHERLYLRADLAQYVEIPTSAILRRMDAPAEQDPHGGVTLWVKQDAKLIYKLAPGAQALAHYFAGQIQAGAALANAPQAAHLPPTLICPTRLPCVSFGPECPPPAAAGLPAQARGVSVMIRSCIWCVPSVHFDCTMLAAGGAQAGIGPTYHGINCVPGSLPECTLRVGAGFGPSYNAITCADAGRCPPTGIDCTLRVDPRAGFNPTFVAATCIYLNCTATAHGQCTM
jgi:hypothetical protein